MNWGVISRLSGPGFTTVKSIITGLPRAYANHGTNSLHFGANGRLFIGQGGNTGGGAATGLNPPSEFNDRPEQPLSTAILMADIDLANPTAFNGECGTPLNELGVPATCDVKVYASGLRNPYDFVLHSNGQFYATDNGNGVSSAYPAETTAPCTSVITDTQQPIYDPGTRPDVLWRVAQGSYYGAVSGRIGNGIYIVGAGTVGGTSYTNDVDVFHYR